MDEKEPVKDVEEEIKTHHPVRTLLLLDIIQDRDSRPTLAWTAATLLFGTVVYHWLEGWSWLNSVYSW